MTLWSFLASLALALVAGGGIGVAVINGRNERKMHKLKRQEEKEDAAEAQAALNIEQRLKAIEEQVQAIEDKTDTQSVAIRYVLYDRIRYIALSYLADGDVDFDDRRILRDMHSSYHNGLGGNGDLDKLMEAVDKLPLKAR